MSHFLDLRGMISPFALLKLTYGFRKLQKGEIMEVIGNNPDSREDILKVLMVLPCKLLYVDSAKNCYFIRLRKLENSEVQKRGIKNDRKHVPTVSPGSP